MLVFLLFGMRWAWKVDRKKMKKGGSTRTQSSGTQCFPTEATSMIFRLHPLQCFPSIISTSAITSPSPPNRSSCSNGQAFNAQAEAIHLHIKSVLNPTSAEEIMQPLGSLERGGGWWMGVLVVVVAVVGF